MNKKLLIILTAALLLLSATACNNTPGGDETTGSETKDPEGSYIVVGTDESGNPVTQEPAEPSETETEFDPTEANPTFTDVTMQVVIFTNAAKIRTSTELLDNNIVGWPSEGKVLNVTGESANWYRITYPVNGEDQTCYVAKTVVADAAVLDAFTAIENGEEVEVIVAAVNVRSDPSADSTASIRGTLAEGTKVTRVAVSENWSRILYEVVSETETDENGEAKVEYKQYYVSNDCLKVVGATETVEETVAETTADAE